MTFQITGKIEVESDQAWIIYDTKTGRIQHVHRVVTLKGGTAPKPSEVEERVRNIVAKKGRNVEQSETLVVSPDQLQPGATHRVDPKNRVLVSEPVKQLDKRPSRRSK